jgi:3-deoxy-7-phosphoheptulonate synthase
MVEVHTNPDVALSDGPQSLYPEQFEQLMEEVNLMAPFGRSQSVVHN